MTLETIIFDNIMKVSFTVNKVLIKKKGKNSDIKISKYQNTYYILKIYPKSIHIQIIPYKNLRKSFKRFYG